MILELCILITIIIYISIKYNNGYWKRRGIPGPPPSFIFGNLTQSFLMKRSPGEVLTDIYIKYKDYPVVGVFRGTSPALLLTTPELIRDVTVKEFGCFQNNDFTIDKNLDPLLGRNPFVLKGEEWKTVRAQITPCFSSGKMKALYPILKGISQQLVKFIESEPDTQNGNGYEAKELCTRFTLNNVATCAFGLDGKCFTEKNSEFRQLANRLMTPQGWSTFKIFFITLFPALSKYVSIKFTPADVEAQLIDIVTQTLKHRKENNIVSNDFLDFINNLKTSCKTYDFKDIDVTAHATTFFGDGYETSSIVMHYILYELARHPKAQTTLREEIKNSLNTNNNEITYEVLQEMSYLDAVLNESFRMHPIVFVNPKMCTKPYVYTPKPHDKTIAKPFTIEEGTVVLLPVYGVQNDARYFEEPANFKPERFLPANKEKITKYSYLPFGEGPRACLGQRFGVLQIKCGIVEIIRNYEIKVNKKTKEPLTYNPVYFMPLPNGGMWLDFKKI